MPDVTGMTLDEAREELEDEGLGPANVIGPVTGRCSGTLPIADLPVAPGSDVQILMG